MKHDPSRRRFLTAAASMLVAPVVAKADEVAREVADTVRLDDGTVQVIVHGGRFNKQIHTVIDGQPSADRYFAIMPPCTVNRERFHQLCIACHQCIAHCPEHILKPATTEYKNGKGLLQPTMSFERGYCRPSCRRCAEVCPTGAIQLVDVARKRADRLGWANFNSQTCVTVTQDVDCDACGRHCPHGAIQMIEKGGHKVPTIDVKLCTGCGACEFYCPARPKAICIEGLMY